MDHPQSRYGSGRRSQQSHYGIETPLDDCEKHSDSSRRSQQSHYGIETGSDARRTTAVRVAGVSKATTALKQVVVADLHGVLTASQESAKPLRH